MPRWWYRHPNLATAGGSSRFRRLSAIDDLRPKWIAKVPRLVPECFKACVAHALPLPPMQRGKSRPTRRSRQRRSSALHGLRASWRSQAHSSSRGRHARTARPCRGCADEHSPREAAHRESQRNAFRSSRDHSQRVGRSQESTRRVAAYAWAARTLGQVGGMNLPQRPKEHTATARVKVDMPRCSLSWTSKPDRQSKSDK